MKKKIKIVITAEYEVETDQYPDTDVSDAKEIFLLDWDQDPSLSFVPDYNVSASFSED